MNQQSLENNHARETGKKKSIFFLGFMQSLSFFNFISS